MLLARKSTEALIEDFALALSLVVRRIRADTPPEFRDFSWTQKAALSRLDKDGPATTSDLARAEGIKPQSMAAAIAALEKIGGVERKAHPTDGRQINLKLTAKGTAMRKSIQEAKRNWLSQAFARLDRSEQATLFQAGEILRRLVEEN